MRPRPPRSTHCPYTTLFRSTGSLSVGNHTVEVTVTGACGTAVQSATLTVQASTATTDPIDQSVCNGADAHFSTTASGTEPCSDDFSTPVTPIYRMTSSTSLP